MKRRRLPDTLKRFPIRQIFLEDHVPRMPNARTRNEANAVLTRGALTQPYTSLWQSHALRLPVRDRPRQHQRKLPPNQALLERRRRLLTENRHPILLVRLTREKAPLLPISTPELHFIKPHDHAQRHRLLRLLRTWAPALRPNETPDRAHRAIHKPCLNPQVRSQQHASALTELHPTLQSSELIITDQRRI